MGVVDRESQQGADGGEGAGARGELRLAMRDGPRDSALLAHQELRDVLVPRLARRLAELGHAVRRIELPSDARPFPGSRFACRVETEDGGRLTVHCEVRARRLRRDRAGAVRYAVEPA